MDTTLPLLMLALGSMGYELQQALRLPCQIGHSCCTSELRANATVPMHADARSTEESPERVLRGF